MGVCGVTLGNITIAVTLFDLIALGIAKGIVGFNNEDSCGSSHNIPLYLKVSGFLPLAYFALGIKAKDDCEKSCWVCIGYLGILFGMGWHIFGSVVAFGGVQQSPKPCPDVLYFAVAMVTFDWIVIVLWFLSCCACCCDDNN